jgi:hypothetical protein
MKKRNGNLDEEVYLWNYATTSKTPYTSKKSRYVATLALGSQPRQGLAEVRTKSEAQEPHFMLSGVWESVKE